MCKLMKVSGINIKLLKPEIFNRLVILKHTRSEIEKDLLNLDISKECMSEIEAFITSICEWKEQRDDRRRC